MINKYIRTTFFYSMMTLLGIILLILGFIFKSNGEVFQRMIKAGLTLLVVGAIFLIGSLKVQSNEKNDKNLKKFNNAMYDERNQLIAGKSASITIELTVVFSILMCAVLSFLGMNSYAITIAGYTVVVSIVRIIINAYLRHKF